LWNDEETGLAVCLRHDPYSVGNALSYVFNAMIKDIATISLPEHMFAMTESPARMVSGVKVMNKSSYDASKTYVILGGIGTIGVHLALFMYEVHICICLLP